mmetsp:Transcript_17968/g.40766  ORF Transcript_17968/g.40766 Transcript_17968/m.40766 type:complete len:204 (+) Transcript_17968:1-612(+)
MSSRVKSITSSALLYSCCLSLSNSASYTMLALSTSLLCFTCSASSLPCTTRSSSRYLILHLSSSSSRLCFSFSHSSRAAASCACRMFSATILQLRTWHKRRRRRAFSLDPFLSDSSTTSSSTEGSFFSSPCPSSKIFPIDDLVLGALLEVLETGREGNKSFCSSLLLSRSRRTRALVTLIIASSCSATATPPCLTGSLIPCEA